MKKLLALVLAAVLVFGMMSVTAAADSKVTINLWSFTDELQGMMNKYLELHPEMAEKYEINSTVINNDGSAYVNALESALMNGEVDIYGAEADYVFKYSQGEAAEYAVPYVDLGIDVAAGIEAAEIAPYTVDIGTRPSDEQVVALAYQSTGGAFIYRRSIAKAVWGTDDPAVIAEKIGAGSNSWDAFFAAAQEVKDAGYAMVSGKGDIWNVIKTAAPTGWVVDNTLNIDPMREQYLDLAKTLKDNGFMNDTTAWQEAWFADMKAESKVFGFYGPAWLINYTLGPNSGEGESSSAGDWAVTAPNVGFYWGGTYLLAGTKDPAKVELIKGFIEWVTLDTTDDGLQYMWANGLMNENGTKDTVASNVVLARSNGETEFLSGQNMFEYFIPANEYATATNMTQYDSVCNDAWGDAVGQYVAGNVDRDGAIALFKETISGKLDVDIDW
mgnify:FL=1